MPFVLFLFIQVARNVGERTCDILTSCRLFYKTHVRTGSYFSFMLSGRQDVIVCFACRVGEMFCSQSRCKITAFFSLLLPDKRTIPANTPLLVLPQGKVYFWG